MGTLGELKRTLFLLRGNLCESCEIRRATQAAHVFFNRDVRFSEHLDVEENITICCEVCHGFDAPNDPWYKSVDTPAFRTQFMLKQLDRGYDMAGYLDDIPSKKKLGSEFKEANVLLERVTADVR